MEPNHERPRTMPVDPDFEPRARGPAQPDEDRGTSVDVEASSDPEPGTEEAGYGYGV